MKYIYVALKEYFDHNNFTWNLAAGQPLIDEFMAPMLPYFDTIVTKDADGKDVTRIVFKKQFPLNFNFKLHTEISRANPSIEPE